MQAAVPARDELLSTARELASLTASCMGPAGQSKFLQMSSERRGEALIRKAGDNACQIGTDRSQMVVTSSGLRLFGEACSLALYSAPARVLVDAVTSQAKYYGDGSLFVVNFACRLLVEALDPAGAWEGGVGLGRGEAHVCREGFALALQWSLEYLNDPACPVRVPLPPQKKRTESSSKYEEEASARSEESSAESTTDAAAATATATAAAESEERVMVALAAGVLGSKPVCRLRPQECRRLAELAVRAFLGSRGLGSDDRMVSNVRVLPMLGPSCSDSEVVENAVLLETPLPLPCPRPSPTNFPGAHRPHPAAEKRARGDAAKSAAAGATAKGRGWAALDQPVSVALFEGSLQMETRDPFGPDPDSGLRADFSSDACIGGGQDFGHGDSEWTAGRRELEELEAFARALVSVGVGIVACQRVIHPYLRRRLAENGVLPLERLSALNIASFQSVTGARLVGSWLGPEPIKRADLGAAGPLAVRNLHGRSFIEVGSASRAALTSLRLSIDANAVRRRMRPVATLVLCAPDRPALDELQITTGGLMRVLAHTTLEGGAALAGAGCWEVHLSSHLRERAKRLRKTQPARPPPPPPPPPPRASTSATAPPDPTAPPQARLSAPQRPPPAGLGRRLSRAGRRRFDSPPPLPPLTGAPESKVIAEPLVVADAERGGGGGDGCTVGPASTRSSLGGVSTVRCLVAGSPDGIGITPGDSDSRGGGRGDKKSGCNGDTTARMRKWEGKNKEHKKREHQAQRVQEADRWKTKPHAFGRRVDPVYSDEASRRSHYGGLASAVERFSSCLEASVCRRGEVAPFSTPSGGGSGGGGVSGEHSCPTSGSSWGNSGGELLPSEVLQALREANSTKGGGGNDTSVSGFHGGGGTGRGGEPQATEATSSDTKRSAYTDDTEKLGQNHFTASCAEVAEKALPRHDSRRCKHWRDTRVGASEDEWREAWPVPCAGASSSGSSSSSSSGSGSGSGKDRGNGDGYPHSNCVAREDASRCLWGLDEEGQALRKVVRYGERGAGGGTFQEAVWSAEVLDGFLSRVRGLENAVEACLYLMLVEGAVYANA